MLIFQNQYADLTSSVLACSIDRSFPAGTNFQLRTISGRRYWYARLPDGSQKYLGPDKPPLSEIVASERDLKVLDSENRAIIRSFRANGFPLPGDNPGRVLASLSDSGFFRLRGVLVGTLAYQTYLPMFGENIRAFHSNLAKSGAMAASRTGDLDFALFHSIAIAIDDKLDAPFMDAIGKAEAFEQIPAFLGDGMLPQWRDKRSGLRVDLLTPFVPPLEEDNAWLPTISASGVKLMFLDFLIYEEIPAVVLHGSGIAVNVPQPHRYAVHKLIISQERRNPVKREKDLIQAYALLRHLLGNDRARIKEVYQEALDRGPGWRRRIRMALKSGALPDKIVNDLSF